MNDPMRDQIRRLDPMPPAVRTIADSGPEAHELLERIMTTNPIDQRIQTPDPAVRRRTWATRSAVGAVGLVAVVAIATAAGLGRGAAPTAPTPTVAVRLALPAADPTGSCLVFDVAVLGQAPIAFGGTVTGIENGVVRLRVDRWYRGGTATTVELVAPAPDSVALDGLAFEEGGRYLVSATGDKANGCGLSGPATPDLRAAFDQAFGG